MKHTKFTSAVALCLAATTLTACMGGPSAKQGVTQSSERKGGFLGLSTAQDVTVLNDSAFKSVDQVVIGGFTVAFKTAKRDSVKAGGGLMGSGFGGKSTAKTKLTGVDDATMQAITDKAYKDFVASLEQSGYKVLPRETFTDSKEYQGITMKPSPHVENTGTLLASGNETKYFAPTGFKGVAAFSGEIAGLGAGMGFSHPGTVALNYANTSKIPVVSALITLDYANADSYGGTFTSSSAISVGHGMSAAPEGTRLSIVGVTGGTFSNGVGNIALGQPISSDKEFATVDDATSGASKGVEVATNIIGAIGGIGTNSSREYTVAADSAKYSAAANELTAKANAALIGKMKSLK